MAVCRGTLKVNFRGPLSQKNSGETFCRFNRMCKSGESVLAARLECKQPKLHNRAFIPESIPACWRNIICSNIMFCQMMLKSRCLIIHCCFELKSSSTRQMVLHTAITFLWTLWLPPLQRKLQSCTCTGWSSRPILPTNLSLLITAKKRQLMRAGAVNTFTSWALSAKLRPFKRLMLPL